VRVAYSVPEFGRNTPVCVEVYSYSLRISRVVLLLLRQRRGCGNDLGTTIKFLRKTTSGAAGIGLGTTIKYPRRKTSAAAGNGLGTTLNYLRGAAGNGRAQQSSAFDAQRASPRATALAPWQINNALRCTTSAAAGNGPGTTIKYSQRTTSGAAVSSETHRSSTVNA
jgi:hypothetical protein